MKQTKLSPKAILLSTALLSSSFLSSTSLHADEQEILENAQQIYKSTDELLNIEYRLLISGLTPAQAAEISQLEREWIDYRDYFLAGPEITQSENPELAKASAATKMTLQRIRFLRVYDGKNVKPELAGNYSDFSGGLLRLKKETESRYTLDLDVVRGRSASNGEITGSVEFRRDRAHFVKEVEGEESPCVLEIKRNKNRITIESESESCEGFHGLQARFTGTYFKDDFKK